MPFVPGTNVATSAGAAVVNPIGELRIAPESTQVFFDDFGAASIDTTNRWASSSGGGGVAPSQVIGTASLATGTTASGFSLLQTINTFLPRNPGYMIAQMHMQVEASPFIPNTYRFWGFASFPGTPTIANPITNGAGFEIGTDGILRAVTYNSNTKNLSAPFAAAWVPIDGSIHLYRLFFRGDRMVWCIDSYDNQVYNTFTGATGPDINTLGWGALCIAGTTAPTTSGVINLAQVTLSDSARNGVQIVDGTFPFRRAAVSAVGGGLAIGTPGTQVNATSGNIAANTATATLPAVTGKTNFLTGFEITAGGATGAAVVTATITGLISGTMNYTFATPAGATLGATPLVVSFPGGGLQASGTGVAIVVSMPTLGSGNTNTTINAHGYVV
jgi:hypothetical protein